METKIAQIGNGKAAKFHRQNYPQDAKLVALVVRNVPKNLKLAKDDSTLPSDIFITDDLTKVVAKFGSLIWDIVADDEAHFDLTSRLAKIDPNAKIMLAKTPYEKDLMAKFQELENQNPKLQISITENYAVSKVVEVMTQLIAKHQVTPSKIILEFSKNRARDIEEGRFIHQSLGVLGYEGSHMLTVLENLGYWPQEIKSAQFENLKLSNGQVLANHGSCLINGRINGVGLIFYTSMNGKLNYKVPELEIVKDIEYKDESRYRLAVIEGEGFKIIGQFDPVAAFARLMGRVLVYKDGILVEKVDNIEDNTVKRMLERQICFLSGGDCPNPMTISKAQKFSLLEEIYQKFAK